jgi:hypothetical protein
VSISTKDIVRLAMTALVAYGRLGAGRGSPPVRVVGALTCAIFALWFGLAAFACGAAALWIFVQPNLGTVGAALIAAAAMLFGSLAAIGIACLLLRSKPKKIAVAPALTLTEQVLACGQQLFKEHKGMVLLAALLAGMQSEGHKRP